MHVLCLCIWLRSIQKTTLDVFPENVITQFKEIIPFTFFSMAYAMVVEGSYRNVTPLQVDHLANCLTACDTRYCCLSEKEGSKSEKDSSLVQLPAL